jgi:predicted metalloendopeptidase
LDLYLKSCGIEAALGSFIVTQPKFFAGLNSIIEKTSIEDWKTYLIWDLFTETSAYLSKTFRDEHFRFFSGTLNGIGVQKPRWKQGIEGVDHNLGEALGAIYVERHFNSDAKKRVNVMVDNLTAAYKMRIESSSWMSAETKLKALDKLSKFTRKLGFPDKWRDYTTLEIKDDALVSNIMRARNFTYKEMIANVGKPVDKTKWGMTPPTVNAYYNPAANEIVFPAGIMQPPFFDPKADDAFNYGIMGAIIGHELSHGFDDEGSKFDGDGNLKNWWSEADLKQFEVRTNVLVNQFNNCVAIDSIHVNGKLTLGENIADLGGLTMAYYAYKLSLGGKKSEIKEGFTGEQRFFIAWAQGWKALMRPAYLKQMVSTNPHAPANFRAYMPLTNMPEFYEAFGVTEKDVMYKPIEKRAVIW